MVVRSAVINLTRLLQPGPWPPPLFTGVYKHNNSVPILYTGDVNRSYNFSIETASTISLEVVPPASVTSYLSRALLNSTSMRAPMAHHHSLFLDTKDCES